VIGRGVVSAPSLLDQGCWHARPVSVTMTSAVAVRSHAVSPLPVVIER